VSPRHTTQWRGVYFLAILASSLVVFWPSLSTLLAFTERYEHYSHIALIPVVTLFLIYQQRNTIFAEPRWSVALGGGILAFGALLWLLARSATTSWTENNALSLQMFGVVITWLGAFLFCFGIPPFRSAGFPLAFLFLVVPIPDLLLHGAIRFLLAGSAELTDLLFKITGVPYYRNGSVFALPGITIEIADECSGIRSSLALFITCSLAGYLFLQSPFRRLILVLTTLPILLLKNAVRIVCLTLLAVYVDPSFLTGRLHRSGGVFFFTLGLLMMWVILHWLQRTGRKIDSMLPEKM